MTCPHFAKFSVHVACGRCSVLLWRQCNVVLWISSCLSVIDRVVRGLLRLGSCNSHSGDEVLPSLVVICDLLCTSPCYFETLRECRTPSFCGLCFGSSCGVFWYPIRGYLCRSVFLWRVSDRAYILIVTHQRQHRGRSLMSTIALLDLYVWHYSAIASLVDWLHDDACSCSTAMWQTDGQTDIHLP